MMPITPDFQGESAGLGGPEGAKPRIAILSASVGSGHVRAAQAIESAPGGLLPDATIAHIDALDLTNGAFRHAYGAGYFRAVQSARVSWDGCTIFWIIPTITAPRRARGNCSNA